MLCTVKSLKGDKLDCLDGVIGEVKEFYFDDQYWTVRYLVADTGTWLENRKVLISPYALMGVRIGDNKIAVELSRKQIENSPSLDTDKPVSRQFEESYYGYYALPAYWDGPYIWGHHPYLERDRAKWGTGSKGARAWDPHLRSTQAVTGYHLQATDGEIGHVVDFVIDDETWTIRYLIVATKNWWPGKNVLISPHWIDRVSWNDSKVFLNLSREDIKRSPEFTPESLISRDYEIGLYGHYNRKGYWADDLITK